MDTVNCRNDLELTLNAECRMQNAVDRRAPIRMKERRKQMESDAPSATR